MPRRPAGPKPPTPEEVAAALELQPTEAERAAGYGEPADLVELVTLHSDGCRWVVITHRASKHYLPVAAVPAAAG